MKAIKELTYRACSGLGLLLLLYGCCTDIHLSLGRYRDSMDVSLDLIGDLAIEIDTFSSFDLDTSIGIWAGFSWSLNADININIPTVEFRIKTLRLDIDRDGVDEAVRALAAVDPLDSDNHQIMVAWKGDKYTLDEKICYLSWLDGSTMVIVSARCNSDDTLRKCEMRVDDASSMSCEGCNAEGECVSCDADDSIDSCKPERESAEPVAPKHAGGERDAVDDATGDAGAPDGGEPAFDAGIDADSRVDRTPCEQQLDELISVASDCGKALQPDAWDLCVDNPSDVSTCYTVYDLSKLLQQNVCLMISDPFTCGAIVGADSPAMNCEAMLDAIRKAAFDCGLTLAEAFDAACRTSTSQVKSCFVAFGTAQSEGEDVCTILGETTTCSILN